MKLYNYALTMFLILGSFATSHAEDVDGHPVKTCTPKTCMFLEDFQRAAEPGSSGYVDPVQIQVASTGFLEVSGQPGQGQDSNAAVFFCGETNDKTPAKFGCDLWSREFPLNTKVKAPIGNYIFVYANSQSKMIQVESGQASSVRLAQLPIPQTFGPNSSFGNIDRFVVRRDFKSVDEQSKTLLGLYALKLNRRFLQFCVEGTTLSSDNLAACNALSVGTRSQELLNTLIKFDVPTQTMLIKNLERKTWQQSDLPALVTNGVVSELSATIADFVSVFPGTYEIEYASDRAGIYFSKQVVIP